MKNAVALLALSMGTTVFADNCCDPYCESCCEEPCAPDFYYEESPYSSPNAYYEPHYAPEFYCEEPCIPDCEESCSPDCDSPYVPDPCIPNFYCEEPCPVECCLKPRDPICCECYTPAFYDPAWNRAVSLGFDFLYWYARENHLAYGAREEVIQQTPAVGQPTSLAAVPTSYKHLPVHWKPGFRLGIGWNTCDGWDFLLNWTHYKGKSKGSISGDSFVAAIPQGARAAVSFWTDPALHGTFLFSKVSAKWRTVFNCIDLELGRRYYLSECFTLRPYAGLRAVWNEAKFVVKGVQNFTILSPTVVTNLFRARDSFHNDNWGVGMLAGFQPVFYLTKCFSFYANADIALLWGKFDQRIRRESCNISSSGPIPCGDAPAKTSDFFGMQPALDLGMGFSWEIDWCDHSYALELSAGWEHHILFNYNSRIQVFAPISQQGTTLVFNTGSQEVLSDLQMGGFILKACFSF